MESPSETMLVEQGRWWVRIAAAALVLTSVASIAIYVARLGTGQLGQQVIRLLLTLGLAAGLVRGRAWARWLTFALMILAMVVAASAFVGADAFRPPRLGGTLLVLAMFLVYGVIARAMIYSASVQAYFRAHKRLRADGDAPAS